MNKKRLIFQVSIKPNTPALAKQGARTWLYTENLFNYSVEKAKQYAVKCNADYELITNCDYRPDLGVCWQRFKYYEYAKHYDEILYLDADIVVFDTAANIFDLVQPNTLAAVQDGDWDSDKKTWVDYLKRKQNSYKSTRTYRPFCSGLLLMDREWANRSHSYFTQLLPHSLNQSQGDQHLLNRIVIEMGEQYNELDHTWGRWDKVGLHMEHLTVPKRRKPHWNLDKFVQCKKTQGLLHD